VQNIDWSASLQLVRPHVKAGPINAVSAITELQLASLMQD